MQGDRLEFDENGDTFFCFLTAFYTLVLIPVTYLCWPSVDCKDIYEQSKRKCMCKPCQIKRHRLKSSSPFRKIRKILIKSGFAIAWGLFLLLLYKITLIEPNDPEFNPFDILEISRTASAKEIRSAYKKLSLLCHPDKGGDPKRFIQISKAYAALTNEESRRNWEEYGNPDGPGAAHFGIALPKWMIQKENFYVVIGAYVLLFVLILPISVGTWWYNTMKFNNNNIFLDTVRHFCSVFMTSCDLNLHRVIKELSNACEFNPHYNKEIMCRPSDNVDLPPLIKQVPYFTIFRKAIVGSPYSVKARALIYAHLERLELPQNTLQTDQQYVVKHLPRLINEMINTLMHVLSVALDKTGPRAKGMHHLSTIENCMRLVPMLVQSLSENSSPILQLPHITQTQLRHMATKHRTIKSVRQLVRLPEDKRRALLRSLSDEQYRDLLIVCASMPSLEVSFKCEIQDDEDDTSIWPLNLVTVTVYLTRSPLLDPAAVNLATSNERSDSHYHTDNGHSVDCGGFYYRPPNSQLYPAARTKLDSEQTINAYNNDYGDGIQKTGPTNYNEMKKPINAVWDKNKKSKRIVRKNKSRRQTHKSVNQSSVPTSDGMATGNAISKALSVNTGDDLPGSDHEVDDDYQLADKKNDNHVNDSLLPVDEFNDGGYMENENDLEVGQQDVDNNTGGKLTHPPDSQLAVNGEQAFNVKDCKHNIGKALVSNHSTMSDSSQCTHAVHCPYFPMEKFECWWIYLVDRKTRHLVTKPIYIANLQENEQFQLRFMAPAIPGQYLYTLNVRSDSYLDSDYSEIIKFTVRPMPDHILQLIKEQEQEILTESSCESSCESSIDEEMVLVKKSGDGTASNTITVANVDDDADEDAKLAGDEVNTSRRTSDSALDDDDDELICNIAQ